MLVTIGGGVGGGGGGGRYHEGVQVGVVAPQVVHDPLDLPKAESPMLPVLAKQGHIGPIH